MATPKLVLLLAASAYFVAILDLTVVNVAFPDMQRDFSSASLPILSWVITGYGVLFAALLVPAGRVADVIGRRQLFAWSVAAFTATSVLAAAAPNEGALIFFRALQGASAAGMIPSALGLILTWTPPERVMPALGVWGAAGSMAAVVGPGVGGVLVEAWSWRAIFLINVPIGLAVLYGTLTKLSRDEPTGRRLPDPVGTVLFAGGVGAVVVGISQGGEWGWGSGSVMLLILGGVLGVGVSLVRSARHPAPAFELDLWGNRTFRVANATQALMGVAAFAWLFNGPLFLTRTWGYSVLEAGLALTPASFISAGVAVVVGTRATTPASRRAAAVAGCLALVAASFFLWATLGTEKRYVELFLPATVVAGAGIATTLTALYGAGATSIPPLRFASGSGVMTMVSQLGGILGVTAAAIILAASGYANAVDPFLAVNMFCAGTGLIAAAAGVGLVRSGMVAAVAVAVAGAGAVGAAPPATATGEGGWEPPHAGDDAADTHRAGGAGGRARLVGAAAVLASLLGVAVFAIASPSPEDVNRAGQGEQTGQAGQTGQAEHTGQAGGGVPPAVRDLAVMEISASMGDDLGPGLTRLQATTQIVQRWSRLLPDDGELGVWLMGTTLQGGKDWVTLLPVGALSEQLGTDTRRQLIQSGLGRVGAVTDDRTGLYDTVLAAFREMNHTYRPDAVNSVLVFTDGPNNDPFGVSLEDLLATLRGEYDPARPVHVTVIGYGGGVDRGALNQIAEATEGSVQIIDSPEQVQAVLAEPTTR
jgi:EmrB/QacA subfamily drug resistance transporter